MATKDAPEVRSGQKGRKRASKGWWMAILLYAGAVAAGEPPGALEAEVRVRDSETGRAIESTLTLIPAGDLSRRVDLALRPEGGDLRASGAKPLESGVYELTASAPGYRALTTSWQADSGPSMPTTLWLSPAEPSRLVQAAAADVRDCPRCSIFSGYVYDRASGRAIAGARVRAGDGSQAITALDGRFELLSTVPAAKQTAVAGDEPLPATTDLVVNAPGYRRHRLIGVRRINDVTQFIVDLERGQGTTQLDLTHIQARTGQRPARTDAETRLTAPTNLSTPGLSIGKAISVPMPSSIRLGTNCSGRNCTGVSVYAFEDYVARGLDDEWIASWHAQSLAAGAVAYRSYAAYYVAHPVNSRYDICNSTSCQVFNADTTSATLAAGAATRGVVLSRDGRSAAFSEYSSENNAWDDPSDGLSCVNNDLSCGNGFNGSPRNNWPCISDEVGRGRGCFGHGRGMSQWGTQRWAQSGRDWRWIANHYFNNNNRPGGMRNAFLANDTDGGGSAHVLDDFETGVGHFRSAPTASGSTSGVATSSTATQDCGVRRNGSCSLRVLLKDDTAASGDWSVRLLSGGGTPASNVELRRAGGRVGVWVFSGGSGMSVGLSVDDSDGTERSTTRSVPANAWTYLEWALDDPAAWNAWVGGDGDLNAATVRLDAVWLYRAQTSFDVNLYLDDVRFVLPD